MTSPSQKNKIESALERRILKGLMVEWDEMTYYLSPEQRRRFRPPIFSLKTFKRRLGCWDAEKREIALDRAFAFNHPWDSITDVLRHEMAHQLTHEVLNGGHEKPHGPTFQMACRLLRADPKASGEYLSLHQRLKQNALGNQDKILIRVRKLMALAESQNQNEAEAAMLKAYELIEKYNIDLIKRSKQREYVSIFIGKPALKHFREAYALAHLIQEHYFVQGIWTRAYVVEKVKTGRVLEISGTRQNVQMAAYVYDFVSHFIDAQWKMYNKNKKLNRYRKTDFAVGIIDGFKQKLENRKKTPSPGLSSDKALMALDDPDLNLYMSHRYPRTRKVHQNALSTDENVVNDGVRIGKKLVISQGITRTGKQKKYLLGH